MSSRKPQRMYSKRQHQIIFLKSDLLLLSLYLSQMTDLKLKNSVKYNHHIDGVHEFPACQKGIFLLRTTLNPLMPGGNKKVTHT